jgi:signal transduction histidine kinase
MAGRVLQPLEDAYQAQRQFVANASHELRAPLTRQRTLIEVALANSGANYASLRQAHERVLASEQQLEQLIDGLLTLTRGQAGLEHREQLDLSALTSEAMLARESELADLELDVRATLDPAPAAGDPRLLERLIANLIDNAIRHNRPGGRIEIATGTRDRHAFVSIASTGPIVPPEQVERLFEPFQRLGAARTHHGGGHGLGLSIVRAVATAHRAELSARSRPEGGLSIDVSFPPASAGPGATLAKARALGGKTERGELRTDGPQIAP